MKIQVNSKVYDETQITECLFAVGVVMDCMVGISCLSWKKPPWRAYCLPGGLIGAQHKTPMGALCGLIQANRDLFGKAIKVVR